MEMSSLTSWIVGVIRRATTRPAAAFSVLVIGAIVRSIWKKRTDASNSENSEVVEKEPSTVETLQSNANGACVEGLDQGKENQNKKSEQLVLELTKSPDSSAVMLSEEVKTLEVSNGFETSSRKGLTEVSVKVPGNAMPEKREMDIPPSIPNGIGTNNFDLENVSCAEATDEVNVCMAKEIFVPDSSVTIINNTVTTVDSSKNFDLKKYFVPSVCHQSAHNRLVATISQILYEYDTNLELVKKSSESSSKRRVGSLNEKLEPSNGFDGSFVKPESILFGFREDAAKESVVLEKFFNTTDKLIQEMEASIAEFRIKVFEIVNGDNLGSSEDFFPDTKKPESGSTVDAISSNKKDSYFEGQDLGYINEDQKENYEQLASDLTESKGSSTKGLSEEAFKASEVFNDFETSFGKDVSTRTLLASDDVLHKKQEVSPSMGSNNSELEKTSFAEATEKDGGRKCSLDDRIDNDKYHKENPSTSDFTNTDFLADNVNACDMLLSLTESLDLSYVGINGFTLCGHFETLSYYEKLLISNLTPGNSTCKLLLSDSNLGSENSHDEDGKVSNNETLGKLKDFCKTNKIFWNFLLGEFLKEGLILNYHIPENDARQGTLTSEYREPEFQYLQDGDNGEKQCLLESSFEESNETTEDLGSGYYLVSSYSLPEEIEGNTSISSLDDELEVTIEHKDFKVKTFRVKSSDLLRYETASPFNFKESDDPFRPPFPSPVVERESGVKDSLLFEDSFTVNNHLVRDGSKTSIGSNKLEADLGELSEDVFSAHKGCLKNDSGKLLQNGGLEESLKRIEGSRSFYTEETDRETGEKRNCMVILQVDPERRPMNAREPNVKGECLEMTGEKDQGDDDDDEEKGDDIEDNSSGGKNGQDGDYEGFEKNGEYSEKPGGGGSGQNGGGTGSSGDGGGDDKKNNGKDSKGKNIKDESSEDEGKSDNDDDGEGKSRDEGDDNKNEEKANGTLENGKRLDDKKDGKGYVNLDRNVSKDPGQSKVTDIALAITSLNMEDPALKLSYNALSSYKVKRKVRTSRKKNRPQKFEAPEKKKVEGEEKDKEGDDDQQIKGDHPSGGKEERGEKDRNVKEGGASSGGIGGAGGGSCGGGGGSSGGGDDKKRGNDFVREKVEDEEESSEEDDKNESKETPNPSDHLSSVLDERGLQQDEPVPNISGAMTDMDIGRRFVEEPSSGNLTTKDFSESEQKEGNSGGWTVPESLQASAGEARSQASQPPLEYGTTTVETFMSEKIQHYFASTEGRNVLEEENQRDQKVQSNLKCSKCKRVFGRTHASEQPTSIEGEGGYICENSECQCECRQGTRSNEDLVNLPQPEPALTEVASTRSSEPGSSRKELYTNLAPTLESLLLQPVPEEVKRKSNEVFQKAQKDVKDAVCRQEVDTNVPIVEQPLRSRGSSISPKKGKTPIKGGGGLGKVRKCSKGPTESKRPERVKDVLDGLVNRLWPRLRPPVPFNPQKVTVKGVYGRRKSTEPKRPKAAEGFSTSGFKSPKAPESKKGKPKHVHSASLPSLEINVGASCSYQPETIDISADRSPTPRVSFPPPHLASSDISQEGATDHHPEDFYYSDEDVGSFLNDSVDMEIDSRPGSPPLRPLDLSQSADRPLDLSRSAQDRELPQYPHQGPKRFDDMKDKKH